ncbi:MAG TPA: hypothetical protein VM143_01460 [Acidimicrobiales bacterium]|nr:hypothetical protein [Acidimicrobiales bacterium]
MISEKVPQEKDLRAMVDHLAMDVEQEGDVAAVAVDALCRPDQRDQLVPERTGAGEPPLVSANELPAWLATSTERGARRSTDLTIARSEWQRTA